MDELRTVLCVLSRCRYAAILNVHITALGLAIEQVEDYLATDLIRGYFSAEEVQVWAIYREYRIRCLQ